MTLLATADSPEASAWAPVPGKLDAIATVRGKTMLLFRYRGAIDFGRRHASAELQLRQH